MMKSKRFITSVRHLEMGLAIGYRVVLLTDAKIATVDGVVTFPQVILIAGSGTTILLPLGSESPNSPTPAERARTGDCRIYKDGIIPRGVMPLLNEFIKIAKREVNRVVMIQREGPNKGWFYIINSPAIADVRGNLKIKNSE